MHSGVWSSRTVGTYTKLWNKKYDMKQDTVSHITVSLNAEKEELTLTPFRQIDNDVNDNYSDGDNNNKYRNSFIQKKIAIYC